MSLTSHRHNPLSQNIRPVVEDCFGSWKRWVNAKKVFLNLSFCVELDLVVLVFLTLVSWSSLNSLFWSSNRLLTVLHGGRNYEYGIDPMTIWAEESLNQNSFRIFLTCCLKGSLKSLKMNSHYSEVAIDYLMCFIEEETMNVALIQEPFELRIRWIALESFKHTVSKAYNIVWISFSLFSSVSLKVQATVWTLRTKIKAI